jgi:hypothetical protein
VDAGLLQEYFAPKDMGGFGIPAKTAVPIERHMKYSWVPSRPDLRLTMCVAIGHAVTPNTWSLLRCVLMCFVVIQSPLRTRLRPNAIRVTHSPMQTPLKWSDTAGSEEFAEGARMTRTMQGGTETGQRRCNDKGGSVQGFPWLFLSPALCVHVGSQHGRAPMQLPQNAKGAKCYHT